MSNLVFDVNDSGMFYIMQRSTLSVKTEKKFTFMMRLRCRCCDKRIPDKIIPCGYCGESVNQLDSSSKYGKWFHPRCFRSFKNFYKSIFSINAVKNRSDLQSFRDHILFEMMMRHDLRLLKDQWSLLVHNRAVPIVLSPLFVTSE